MPVFRGDDGPNFIEGTGYADVIYGLGGNDTLIGGAEDDVIYGGIGDDYIDGDAGSDTLYGGLGNDTFHPGNGGEVIYGGAGSDWVSFRDLGKGANHPITSGANVVLAPPPLPGNSLFYSIENLSGSRYADHFRGDDQANILSGLNGNDSLHGAAGADTLLGGRGEDLLWGGAGSDVLVGGQGADTLIGGLGVDTFAFRGAGHSTIMPSGRDTIRDFSGADGDMIDLSALDADVRTESADPFVFIGEDRFSGDGGEVRVASRGETTFVLADTDGDGSADFSIRLIGVHALSAGDFLL